MAEKSPITTLAQVVAVKNDEGRIGSWEVVRRLVQVLTPADRRRLCGLMLLTTVAAGFEALGIGLILPFMAALNAQSASELPQTLNTVYQFFGFQSYTTFLMWSCLCLLGAFVLKNVVCLVNLTLQSHVIYGQAALFGERLIASYLGAPYEFFMGQRSTELGKYLIGNINNATTCVLLPLMRLVTECVTMAAIVGLIFYVHPKAALVGAGIVVLIVGAFFRMIKGRLTSLGGHSEKYIGGLYRTCHQAFGGIKDVKINHLEQHFVDEYGKEIKGYADVQAKYVTLQSLPRYVIETVGITILIFFVGWQIKNGAMHATLISQLSVVVVAAYRMLPGINQILANLSSIRYSSYAFNNIFEKLREGTQNPVTFLTENDLAPMPFSKSIHFRAVMYTYPGAKNAALKGVNLEIKKGQSIGIVGRSGAGKTTLVDVLLGLLSPDEGVLTIDDIPIDKGNLGRFQKLIGYVPQQITIFDTTLSENIAFGAQVDDARVWRCLKLAALEDFVRALPEGLSSPLGENGAKLSGGQRQRVGIARALYREPEILVMDEATSALDNITEREFAHSINGLAGQKTVIVVAHRLSTVRNCDRIVLMSNGSVDEVGTFDSLASGNPLFKDLIKSLEKSHSEIVGGDVYC